MRVFLDTVGCRLNQSEIETLAREFRRRGDEVVTRAEDADLVVVNTCAVTREAARSSRQVIRRAHRDNARAEIVATGCYAHLKPAMVAQLPGVTQVVNNLDKDSLVSMVAQDPLDVEFEREPLERSIYASALSRTRAFVKVQDGCDNRCTFCVTTIARGPGRSRPQAAIVEEVQTLAAAGYQEAVLTGVHLGSYGHDHGSAEGLFDLVRAVLAETDIPRLRLSSLEPWDLSPDFFTLWQDPRMCRHLHLPLQSGCDATLKRMARRTSQRAYRSLIQAARQAVPGVAISTDVIVGFPGETDAEFEISRDFIREMDFMKLHVFRYSSRPGTAAARMPGHVDDATKRARSAVLLDHSEDGARRFYQRLVGQTVDVLWEQVTGASEVGFVNSGLTDNYVRVKLVDPEPLTNQISTVRVTDVDEGCVVAERLAQRQ